LANKAGGHSHLLGCEEKRVAGISAVALFFIPKNLIIKTKHETDR